MFECNYLDEKMYKSFIDECEELIMLLTSIIKTYHDKIFRIIHSSFWILFYILHYLNGAV